MLIGFDVPICLDRCCGAASPAYKIGLVTGTVSQGEDEYRAAEKMVAQYGDMIKHVTYPDNFMQEQETTIAQITGLAAERMLRLS